VLKQLSFYDVLVCFTAALCRATSQLAENQPQILFCCMVCATLFSTIAWMVDNRPPQGLSMGDFQPLLSERQSAWSRINHREALWWLIFNQLFQRNYLDGRKATIPRLVGGRLSTTIMPQVGRI
jgi:hypothetical protein